MEVVDPDGAVAQPSRDPPGAAGVGGPDGSGKAVLGVVGEEHRLLLRAEGLDGEDRSEDLLADDLHLAVAVVEDGRLVEVAGLRPVRGGLRALAAAAQHRTLGERGGDVRLDLGALLFGDERAALDAVLGAAAEPDPLGAAGEFGDETVADGLLDDEAAAGRADLAAVDERGVEGLVDGGVEALIGGTGVGEDHVGVLAAEFEGDLLDGGGGGLGDLGAADQAAGEGDQVHAGVLGEAGADGVARSGDQVGDAGRQAGLGQQVDQRDGRHRRDLAGLDHEGVARGERRGDLPTGLEQRVVPGRDHGADADRLMDDDAVDVGRARVDHPAGRLGGDQVGEVAEGVGDAVDVDASLLEGLARVPALQQAEFLTVADEEVGDAAQQGGALGDGGAGPGALVECLPGRGHRPFRVLLVALRDHGEGPGVRGVEDLARRAGDRFQPLASRVDGRPGLSFRSVRHDRYCLPFLFSAPVSQTCHSQGPSPPAPGGASHAQSTTESAPGH